jgi:hypothetical protein
MMQKRKENKNMLCISLRMPIREEHYHLRSTHMQHKENQEYTREKNEDYCAIRLQNTHTQTNKCFSRKK